MHSAGRGEVLFANFKFRHCSVRFITGALEAIAQQASKKIRVRVILQIEAASVHSGGVARETLLGSLLALHVVIMRVSWARASTQLSLPVQ
jgi:hypothetical protein